MIISKLKPGDVVDIVAPSSRAPDIDLALLMGLLHDWQLQPRHPENIYGDDLLCANSDSKRLELLEDAIHNPISKALICVRGGYGSTRLLPHLKQSPPPQFKLFIGMSDVTALHLHFQQQWQWPTLHAAIHPLKFSKTSMRAIHDFLLKPGRLEYQGSPVNLSATEDKVLCAPIIGGNLALIQSTLSTAWQMQAKDKFIFLEEIGERGYRVDRMLTHLMQANLFEGAKAVILGDFIHGAEKNGRCLVEPVLERFANTLPIPVLRIKGIGHDYENRPLPFGVEMNLQLGQTVKLSYPHS